MLEVHAAGVVQRLREMSPLWEAHRAKTTERYRTRKKEPSMAALYSEQVMDHFANPRNVGELADADGVGEVGNAKCGDIMKMYIKVATMAGIADVKFKTLRMRVGDRHQLHRHRNDQGQDHRGGAAAVQPGGGGGPRGPARAQNPLLGPGGAVHQGGDRRLLPPAGDRSRAHRGAYVPLRSRAKAVARIHNKAIRRVFQQDTRRMF